MINIPAPIFISYSRNDVAFVDRIETDLKAQGFSPWIDRRKLEAGDDWSRELGRAIEKCPIMLVILSPAAIKSKYVYKEYFYAEEEGKIVIPLLYQDCEIPWTLRYIQRVSFLESYEAGFEKLLDRLKKEKRRISFTPAVGPIKLSHGSEEAERPLAKTVPSTSPTPDPQPATSEMATTPTHVAGSQSRAAATAGVGAVDFLTGKPVGIPPHRIPSNSGRRGSGHGSRSRRSLGILGLLVLAITFLLSGGLMAYAQPKSLPGQIMHSLLSQQPAVSITIVPSSQIVRDTYTLTAALMTSPTSRQVAIRTITGAAQSSAIVVKATGLAQNGPANYTFLQQFDVNNAVSQSIKDVTKQDALNDLKIHLGTGEQWLGSINCIPTLWTDQPIGDQGINVNSANVSYLMKCTATKYDNQGAQTIVKDLLKQEANRTLPPSYILINNIQVSLNNQATANTLSLFFSGKGIWAYQFTDAQKLQLAKSIAGKTVAQAQAILKSTTGIGNSTINVNGGNTLPTDYNQISIVMQPIAGLGGGETPSPSGSPTVTNPTVQSGTPGANGKGGSAGGS